MPTIPKPAAITTHAASAGIRFNPLESLHLLVAARFIHWQYGAPNYKTGVSNTYRKIPLSRIGASLTA